MKYISIDGDDIGRKITNYYLTNDEIEMKKFSMYLCEITDEISKYLIGMNCNIIFSAADGIVASVEDDINIKELFFNIKKDNLFDITFSAGIGNSLQEAYIALVYSKSNGKNCLTEFSEIKNYGKIEYV